MATARSQLTKRLVAFLVFTAAVVVLISLLPFVENFFWNYLAEHYGVMLSPDGTAVTQGPGPHSVLAGTLLSLALNFFRLLRVILWMAVVIAVVRAVWELIQTTVFRGRAQSEISSLIRTVISIAIYIVAFFVLFQSQYPGVQLAPLFTGSTILGIVVGLALQDTLGNLFAGIAMQADKPFVAGDVISLSSGRSGVVEMVSWRGVKIRTFQNKLLVMSNSMMAKEALEVASQDDLSARIVNFETDYSQSPAHTIHVVREAVRQIDNVSAKIRPIVRIRNLGASSLEWEVKYWTEDYKKFNDTDSMIRQRIWYVFNRENIEFAHPTQTIYVHEAPPAAPETDHVATNVERLASIPIFSPLSADEVERLAEHSQRRVYAPGEAIVKIGQEDNSMFVIRRGSVDVRAGKGNDQRTINTLDAGDYFGEMSLLTGEPRTATVIAKEETIVVQITKAALKPILESNPELVDSIVAMVAKRREALDAARPVSALEESEATKGILTSIKRFFGLG